MRETKQRIRRIESQDGFSRAIEGAIRQPFARKKENKETNGEKLE